MKRRDLIKLFWPGMGAVALPGAAYAQITEQIFSKSNDISITETHNRVIPHSLSGLIENFKFSNYISCSKNLKTYNFCKNIALAPNIANPLFITSECGNGKTHLMHAIGHAAMNQAPSLNVFQIHSEPLYRYLISDITYRETDERRLVKIAMHSSDLILIDSFDYLYSKLDEYIHNGSRPLVRRVRTIELQELLTILINMGKQIIVTSSFSPESMPNINVALTDAEEIVVKYPERSACIAIVKNKAHDRGYSNISNEVSNYIVDVVGNYEKNVRLLEGSTTRACASALFRDEVLTLSIAREALHVLEKSQCVL